MTSTKPDPRKMFFLRICSFYSLLFQADEVRSQHNRKKQLRCQRHCRSWGNSIQEGVLWVSARRGWVRRIYWLRVLTCVSGSVFWQQLLESAQKATGALSALHLLVPPSHIVDDFTDAWRAHFAWWSHILGACPECKVTTDCYLFCLIFLSP